MKNKLVFLLCVFVFVACGKNGSQSFEETLVEEVFSVDAPTPKNIDQIKDAKEDRNPQKIIKHGRLQFETTNLDQTSQQIYDAAKKLKARIQSDREEKEYNTVYRDITLRVLNENFEQLVNEVSAGVGYFDHKNIFSQDVTEQYIDLEARLKAKKELENRYLELLKKANKISEILEIEIELVIIREEIESRQGQLNYLKNRVAMSTLEVRFYKQTSETGVTVSYGSKMWHSVKSGFELISGFFLGVLHIWPFLLLFGLVLYYFVGRKKRLKNKE